MTVLAPEQAKAPNHVWTLDFVQDRLSKGTGIRLLTVLDEFTRESLCIRVERRLRSEDVRLTLETLFKDYGIPAYLRSDNGSEFIAHCLQGWLETQGTRPLFIEPGSPWQNGLQPFTNEMSVTDVDTRMGASVRVLMAASGMNA